MSELLNSNTFGDKIYDRFPEMYKRDDKETGYQLKRFIQTAGEGFKCVIDEINGISDLRDNDKVDSSILPVIYASQGLEVFNGIPEPYLRNLIPLLNSLFSRKGSISAVDYLCSIISGVICHIFILPVRQESVFALVSIPQEAGSHKPMEVDFPVKFL